MFVDKNNAKELSYISKWAGCSEDIVQAGGGNTSVKQENGYMLIKSSGYSLSDVTDSEGYSVVDYKMIMDLLDGKDKGCDDKSVLSQALVYGKKPSIETFLHSMTKKYTIHTHPLCVTMLAVRKNGMEVLKELFEDAVTVGYAVPGFELSKMVYEAVKEKGRCDVIFLKNHGLIVSSDTMCGAVELQEQIITRINSYLGIDSEDYLLSSELFKEINALNENMIVYLCDNQYVSRALEISGGKEWVYRYSPDCIVYCGGSFASVDDIKHIPTILSDYTEKNGLPKIILVNNKAFVVAENMRKVKETEGVLIFTAKIYISEHQNDICTLGKTETDFLLNWDSEKYRRTIKY